MVCCIVAAIVLVVLHRLTPWRNAVDEASFAPVASRPAPGQHPLPTPLPLPPSPRVAVSARLVRFATLAAVVYLAGTIVMVSTGAADRLALTAFWAIHFLLIGIVTAAAATIALRLAK